MSLNNSYEEADPAQPGNVHGYEIQDVDVREDPVQEPPEQPAEKKSRFKNPFKRSKKDKIIEPEDGPDPYHEPEPDQEPDDEVQKSDKKSKNKLKGLFKKKKKTATDDSSETRQTELVEPEETEENGMHDTSRHSQASGEATPVKADLYGDSTVTTSPNQTQSRDASTMDSFRRFWARPPPDPEVAQNRAELKEPEEKSWFRWSVFIVVLLCTGFVVGILITALAGDNKAMQVIGPVFIVLSLFALIGKIFWTLFWTPETHAVLKPVAQNINMLMYGPSGKRPDPMKKPAPGSYPRQTYTASGQIYQPSPQIHVQIYTNPAAQV